MREENRRDRLFSYAPDQSRPAIRCHVLSLLPRRRTAARFFRTGRRRRRAVGVLVAPARPPHTAVLCSRTRSESGGDRCLRTVFCLCAIVRASAPPRRDATPAAPLDKSISVDSPGDMFRVSSHPPRSGETPDPANAFIPPRTYIIYIYMYIHVYIRVGVYVYVDIISTTFRPIYSGRQNLITMTETPIN